MSEAEKCLLDLQNRLELIYRLCCGTAPKQSVGELIDVMRGMQEWNVVQAALATPVAAAAPGADDNGCKSCAILRRYEKTARERGYAMGKAAGNNELAQAQALLAAERKAHAETNTALTAEITRLESLLR